MTPSETLRRHRDEVLAIALGNGAKNVRVFGSVSRGSDMEGSDLDLLVDVSVGTTLLDMARMQIAIEKQLGVPVDILTEQDLSPRFRQRVLAEARSL